jgi:hypothetical protein
MHRTHDKPLVALAVSALAGLLLGADGGCPLFASADTPGGTVSGGGSEGGSGGGADIDLGGVKGATWKLTYGDQLLVTLRQGGQVASTSVKRATGGMVHLLGNTVDLTTFCWRTDAVCPSQVLTGKTSVVQPSNLDGRFVIGFARRGPLAGVQLAGLVGKLESWDLTIPLGGAANGKSDPCTLVMGSTILATASPSSSTTVDAGAKGGTADGGARATSLKGRVTLGFKGTCFLLGAGSGAVDSSATIELSSGFSGLRLD